MRPNPVSSKSPEPVEPPTDDGVRLSRLGSRTGRGGHLAVTASQIQVPRPARHGGARPGAAP